MGNRIEWTRPGWDDRLVMHVGGGAVERAEGHAAVAGRTFGYVRKEHLGMYFETYEVAEDGTATKLSGSSIYDHYEASEGNVRLVECDRNIYRGRGRGYDCSMCKAEAV